MQFSWQAGKTLVRGFCEVRPESGEPSDRRERGEKMLEFGVQGERSKENEKDGDEEQNENETKKDTEATAHGRVRTESVTICGT